MKYVIEKGYVVGTKVEKWSAEDGRTGFNLKLCVKERVGDGEFDSVIIHELDVFVEKPENFETVKNMYDSYKDKVVKIEGDIFSRKFVNKDKRTSVFATYYVDTIELV